MKHEETANLLTRLSAPARQALATWLRVAPARPSAFERLCRTPVTGVERPPVTPEQSAALAGWRGAVQAAVADRLAHLLAPLTTTERGVIADVLTDEAEPAPHDRLLQKFTAFERRGLERHQQ